MAEQLLTETTSEFDNLLGGTQLDTISKEYTLLTGQVITRGTLMGEITKAAPSPANGTPNGGNTGNGTITLVALKKNTKLGTYRIILTGATTLRVVDPDGVELEGQAALGAYANDSIGFTSTAGATPFIAGDSFTIVISAGSGKVVKSLSTAVDGSQEPSCIATEDKDATAADIVTNCYIGGIFNPRSMTFGASHTAASVFEKLRDKGIYLKTSLEYPV